TRHNRVETRKLDVLVIQRLNIVAPIGKSTNHIVAKLAVGTDYRDLHARPAFRITIVAVVIDSLSD
ncbi:MAG: hypothetical protein WA594_01930, partial [Candidatus Sulfotelmatobacter sp.]